MIARPGRPWRLIGLALTAVAVIDACGGSSPGTGPQRASPSQSAAPVTAVPATTPPRSPIDAVPASGIGTRLGPWRLASRFVVLAALSDQGLATLSRPGKKTTIVFRGPLSIRKQLRQQGWNHIGDPDAWHGYLFDAYQASPPTAEKLFEVTGPAGATHDFIHPLDPGEALNNSFVAVSPSGQWMVAGEWNEMDRLLVFPTPVLNHAALTTRKTLPMAGTISLDHPVRDVQGCDFVTSTKLLCSTNDPSTDLWPTPYQLLSITFARALVGTPVTGHVSELGELPRLSNCTGPYEVEGIDFQVASGPLRVEVRPPGKCGLATTVYDYRR
ncbi:MAG: hypothetical protein ACRDQH_05190 [Pseudonocardiaceae bacterium]